MGSLADLRSQDIAAMSMKEAAARAGFDSSEYDACIYSEAKQSSFPANIGRHGWLLAGLAENPAGFTLNALCAGAIQTMISAYNKIISGEYTAIMAGGIETNSQAQHYLVHPRYKFGPENLCFHDSKVDVEINAQPVDIYGELSAYTLADIIAANYGLSRSALDEYAAASKAKAASAIKQGLWKEAIVSFTKKVKKAEMLIDTDDAPKAAGYVDLMELAPVNATGTATIGNVAPLADGSASIAMLSADRAQALGAQPLARMLGFGVAAGNPRLLEITTLKSIEKALKATGTTLNDIDFIDFHEPSAAYGLVVLKQLGRAAEKTNVDGGSLGYGHAGAATGGIMVANMVCRLQTGQGKLGLVNVGALGGQSLTVVLERI
jgi:acetyl-CoA C-acetyltransferase